MQNLSLALVERTYAAVKTITLRRYVKSMGDDDNGF